MSERSIQLVAAEPQHPAARRADYQALIQRLRAAVPQLLPGGGRVLVVSRGDDQLLQMPGLQSEHFPRAPDGRYAGHYPIDSEAATAHLEDLRASGAQYRLFPATALWWLDHYGGLRQHLEQNYRQVYEGSDFALYALAAPTATDGEKPRLTPQPDPQWEQILQLVEAVLPPACPIIVLQPPDYTIGEPGPRNVVTVELQEPVDGGQLRDTAGLLLSFRLRDVARQGIDYVVVPHPATTVRRTEVVLAALRERHRLVLYQRDVCTVLETRQATAPATTGLGRRPQ